MSNKAVLLKSYPQGNPQPSDFEVEERPKPTLSDDGALLLHLRFISVDPYMRGRMRPANAFSYTSGFPLTQPIVGGCVAEVLESKSENFATGDFIVGALPWIEYQEVKKDQLAGVVKWRPIEGIPHSAAVGVLGMPGMTAYFGLLELSHPKEGETLVVSGAAGAVGSLVGQIGKIKGCRVVGIAGTDEKCALLREKYHFDDAINYKTHNSFEKMREALKQACPKGIDVYFDNTSGFTSDAVLLNMNTYGRISACGAIDVYNEVDILKLQAPRLDFIYITRQVRKEGFIVYRWLDRWPEGIKQMAEWIKQGKLKFDETVVEGIENTPKAFIDMLSGANIGKMVVKV